jgi:hypothetical protein
LAVLASFALPAASALAQVASGLRASLIVQEAGSAASTTIPLDHLFTFNEATGQLALVTPGTPVGSSGWQWVNEAHTVPGTTETQTSTSLRLIDQSQSTLTLLNAAGKIDPFMTYSFSVKNNSTSTQTYTFVFGEAIVPTITGDYTLFADIGVSLSTSTPPATIAPVGAKLQDVRFSTDGGATTFSAGVGVGNTLTRLTNGTSTSYDTSGLINGTTGLVLNYWEFHTTFTLTPGGDAVGLSGFAEITPIPEPGSFALLAAGATLGLIARRRMRLGRPASA